VIYQIYVRGFADGNNDGVGDITGIRSRLPYLAELGVDAIWITPWYPSPDEGRRLPTTGTSTPPSAHWQTLTNCSHA
jgi:glycosidase